ncbi:hypothetical protein H5410_015958 [Solanum commersonii]|uniref:Uncharacterized protein n=1 Tax=Solanum commersonii TaxID=4109 RepID=A0A9J5ZV54_SOLCO|nr:hypothetical protein H5410_015958 [Solanum commersonii]
MAKKRGSSSAVRSNASVERGMRLGIAQWQSRQVRDTPSTGPAVVPTVALLLVDVVMSLLNVLEALVPNQGGRPRVGSGRSTAEIGRRSLEAAYASRPGGAGDPAAHPRRCTAARSSCSGGLPDTSGYWGDHGGPAGGSAPVRRHRLGAVEAGCPAALEVRPPRFMYSYCGLKGGEMPFLRRRCFEVFREVAPPDILEAVGRMPRVRLTYGGSDGSLGLLE